MLRVRVTPIDPGKHAVHFALNDTALDVDLAAPDQTILELLRTDLGRCGTKEGCASGDCGACTVLVGRRDEDGDGLVYEAVNACIAPAATLAGRHLVTVEGLASDAALHPAQQAMVDCHGAQCGFCTPGFVMSLAALHERTRDGEAPDHDAVVEGISGNLCRCTGYRPILEAGARMAALPHVPPLAARAIMPASPGAPVSGYAQPIDRAALDAAWNAQPDARLIAGGTDLMLEHTQTLTDLPMLIDVSQVREMRDLEEQDGHWHWGASVPLGQIREFFAARLPDLAELLTRYGSPQIRNRATLGGSLGTASPIGDLSPVLQALGATLVIGCADGGTRELAIDAYHLGYREHALANNEYVLAARVPVPGAEDRVHIRKFSKRFEDDISSVLGAARLRTHGDGRVEARLAFGGIDAVPRRVPELEALFSQPEPPDADAIRQTVISAVTPIDDVRASAAYRRELVAAFVAMLIKAPQA